MRREPSDRKKVIILGGGPNRIGQGIEFDYCCCHAAFALDEAGYESIMVNCNPETVSTDYDTSDRLYFEPLTAEDVLEIVRVEMSKGTLHGVIVQFGGQTPLKLAEALQEANVPILGTSPDAIDLAEDRDRFQKLLAKLDLRQPKNSVAHSIEQARIVAEQIGFPVVIRPSYVLGGRAMEIVRDAEAFETYLQRTLSELVPHDIRQRYPNDKTGQINAVLARNPLLFDSYLSGAIEIDVDALCDGEDVFVCGIMEHIEEAGIHSGDSACSLPAHSLTPETISRAGARNGGDGPGARRRRPDERAIRAEERRHLRHRGQSARLAHGAVRRQDHRPSGRQDRGPGDGRRKAPAGDRALRHARQSARHQTTSRSKKRCSRSPASPASIPCSARRCAPPARSWASTATTRWPSQSPSSAAAPACRRPAPSSSPCATRTRSRCCRRRGS